MKLKLLIVSILVILGFVAYKQYQDFAVIKSVSSYDSCAAAKGSIIQESYPATCVTRLGTHFTQHISNIPIENIQVPVGWTKENKCRGGHLDQDNYICLKSPDFTENPIPTTTSGTLIILAMPGSSSFVGGSSSIDFCQEDPMSSFASCDQMIIKDQKIIKKVWNNFPWIDIAIIDDNAIKMTIRAEYTNSKEMTEGIVNQILSTFKFTD